MSQGVKLLVDGFGFDKNDTLFTKPLSKPYNVANSLTERPSVFKANLNRSAVVQEVDAKLSFLLNSKSSIDSTVGSSGLTLAKRAIIK